MTISTPQDAATDSDASLSSDRLFSEERRIKQFVKSLLKGSLFVGSFVEQRFVQQLNAYRDVVKISDDETSFIENLKVAMRKIQQFYITKEWLGFTQPDCIGAPAGYNIWTVLSQEVFGMYWFKVRRVEFLADEIRLKLEIVRPYVAKPEINQSKAGSSVSCDESTFNFSFSESAKTNLTYFFTTVATPTNIVNSLVFLSLLLASIVTGGVHLVQYLMEYLLKLSRELQGLIKVLTPTFLAIINLFGKVVMGFYMLISSMWQTRHTPRNMQQQLGDNPTAAAYMAQSRGLPMPQQYNPVYNRSYSRGSDRYYNDRRYSGVTITPLDD